MLIRRASVLTRFKFQVGFFSLSLFIVLCLNYALGKGTDFFDEEKFDYKYEGHTYKRAHHFEYARGEMVVYYDTEELCDR